ncbi:signal peptidase I [Paenibacillus silviterrae]|uniref:signal peptidase I n=1 Tax=Paenibacillus silviterrae TaxID=3242194 RepID=UPI0025432B00|nr:signal peptidase I [Paenibacillus chinjuensis]
MKSVLKEAMAWTQSIAAAIILTFLIGVFVIQPTKVSGHSMDPTLHDEQRIYVSKLGHTFRTVPDYGDIVIIDSRVERKRSLLDDFMEHPLLALVYGQEDERIMYVKRVIGKPGDVLELRNQQLLRNGAVLEEPYIREAMRPMPDMKWVVPEDHIFVMGDNRNNSRDSRDLGFIPFDHVLGVKLGE